MSCPQRIPKFRLLTYVLQVGRGGDAGRDVDLPVEPHLVLVTTAARLCVRDRHVAHAPGENARAAGADCRQTVTRRPRHVCRVARGDRETRLVPSTQMHLVRSGLVEQVATEHVRPFKDVDAFRGHDVLLPRRALRVVSSVVHQIEREGRVRVGRGAEAGAAGPAAGAHPQGQLAAQRLVRGRQGEREAGPVGAHGRRLDEHGSARLAPHAKHEGAGAVHDAAQEGEDTFVVARRDARRLHNRVCITQRKKMLLV